MPRGPRGSFSPFTVPPSRLAPLAPQDEGGRALLQQARGLEGCSLDVHRARREWIRSTHLPHPEVRAERASKDALKPEDPTHNDGRKRQCGFITIATPISI